MSFLELEYVGVKRFLLFLVNDKTDLPQNFFSGFRRKHLFIITCIEKHCTGHLTKLGNVFVGRCQH